MAWPAPSPKAVPLAALFGKSDAVDVKVSPGGTHLAWLARGEGSLNLWLAPIDPATMVTTRSRSCAQTKTGAINIIPGSRQLTKVPDNRDICFTYLFTHDDKRIVYLRETEQGSEMYHLYSLDLTVSEPVESGTDMLAGHPNLTCSVGFVGGLQLWLPPVQPHMVILSTGSGSLFWNLSSLDLNTGELTTLYANPVSSMMGITKLLCLGFLNVIMWLCSVAVQLMTLSFLKIPTTSPCIATPLQYFVDKRGDFIGCAECCLSFTGISLRFSQRSSCGRWERVGRETPLADLNMQLVGSGAASGTLRLDRVADGGVAIHTCDAANTTAYVEYPRERVLANHPEADISSFITNPVTGTVEAVQVITDRSHLISVGASGERFVQAVQRAAESLGRSSAADSLAVCSRSATDDIWVICVSSDAKPAMYYLIHSPYDSVSPPTHLLTARPLLLPYTLCEAAAVQIPARDGLLLPGYLTFPATGPRQHLSLVLVLHGGPSARDLPGYNPLVQLLAARGMAVLTVNYRGSTGYGMQFLRRGNGAVKEMHQDVEDARLWAVREGVADPKRVAVLGGSWGGYLALGAGSGLADSGFPDPASCDTVKTPCRHKYAAVVAIVPLVAVGKANNSTAFRGDPLVARYWRQIYGAAVSDSQLAAEALSPLHRMQQLKGTKLLLVHGEDDPRVPRQHSDKVAAAARSLGVPGGYVSYSGEGHSIRREPNVLHMWGMVERFLCSSLDLPSPPQAKAGGAEHSATVHWSSSPGLLVPPAEADTLDGDVAEVATK